jgi:oligo-1,6-glucosidase
MKWWIAKGIDGFRLDVINAISKVPGLPSVPGGTGYQWGGKYFLNGPRVHEFLQEMNREVLCKHDLITVGETGGVTTHDAIQYANAAGTELNMVFQFEHTDVDSVDCNKWKLRPWSLVELKQIFGRWQKDLYNKAWNSLYLMNHDQPRALSRFGDDVHFRVESATMLATYLHGMGGTPYIYQGEEIGMTNMVFHSLDEYRDVESLNFYKDSMQKDPSREAEYSAALAYKGRDNARTPMQWDASPNAGFTTGEPWIRVNPNCASINAAAAVADPKSIYHYYRALIALRKRSPVMVYGTYSSYLDENEDVAVYARSFEGVHWLVICNFREVPYTLGTGLPAWAHKPGRREIGNYWESGDSVIPAGYTLRPFESLIVSWTA